ncbi:dehydrogenase/reductase (SDR family) member 3 [Cricetulus griseus]
MNPWRPGCIKTCASSPSACPARAQGWSPGPSWEEYLMEQAGLPETVPACSNSRGSPRGLGRQVPARRNEKPVPGECESQRDRIVLWGRTEKCLKETTEEIRQMGTECHYFICDVGNREEVYQMAKAVREKVGDITILVNNAAVVHGKSLMDSDDDALLKSQHVNTLGQFWTTKAFLPRMLELQNGHIVCLNSVLALSAIPGAIDYCTSKASAFAFMESLTLGLLDCPGVSATTVLPFHTSTEMFQGMRVRFPNLFPPLKPETVARRTVEAVQQNQALLLLPWTMNILVILKSKCPALQGKRLFGVCSVFWESWATTGPEWKEGLLDSKANCEEMSKLIEEGDLGQDWVIAKTRGDCMRPLYTIIMDVAGLSAVAVRLPPRGCHLSWGDCHLPLSRVPTPTGPADVFDGSHLCLCGTQSHLSHLFSQG